MTDEIVFKSRIQKSIILTREDIRGLVEKYYDIELESYTVSIKGLRGVLK